MRIVNKFLDLIFVSCFGFSIACMKLEEYLTAKTALEKGASLTPDGPEKSRFTSLIKECDEQMAGKAFHEF